MPDDAEERLRDLRARVTTVFEEIQGNRGFGDWDGLRRLQKEVYAAEREAARVRGDEYAVELDVDAPWDTGAPLPHLFAYTHHAVLLYYLRDPGSEWPVRSVRVVDPTSEEPAKLGVARFNRVYSVKLGGPNDEALAGHPLSGKGLIVYGAHRVVNSRWIAHEEKVNSVHRMHRGDWHDRLEHYVFCFHDETFECLAESFTTEQVVGTPRDVLRDIVDRPRHTH